MAQHGMEVDDTSSRKPLVSVEGGDKAPSAPTALAAAGGAGSDQQDTWGPRSSNTGPDAVPSAETGGSKGTKAPARDRSPHEKELLTPEELEAAGFCPVKRECVARCPYRRRRRRRRDRCRCWWSWPCGYARLTAAGRCIAAAVTHTSCCGHHVLAGFSSQAMPSKPSMVRQSCLCSDLSAQ